MKIRQSQAEETPLEVSKVGKRGSVVIPARLRRKFGIKEGTIVVAEARSEGVLIRPAVTVPVEIYSDERKAEFLLTNALDQKDYDWAVKEVEKLGLEPRKIPHRRPSDT